MQTNRKTRVAVYLRVSTEEQRVGYGIAVQEEQLRAFVKSQEYSLSEEHVYRDEGYSGSLPIAQRPAMRLLFEDAKRHLFDLALVARLDRFFRKSRLLLEAVETLDSYGVGFRSISEPFDTSNAMGRFMLQSLGAIAELERETIKERMQGGRAMAAKSGKWVMGMPPYGYKVNRKTQKLEVVPEEATWVKKFFEWLVYEHCPLREIARRANTLNAPTKNERMKTKRKFAKMWWVRTIGRMLTNEVYTGVAYFRKYKMKHKDLKSWLDPTRVRAEGEWIPIEVPTIVSRELFEAGVRQLKKNREFASRKAKRSYLFSKLLYCGVCGFRMRGGFSTPKTPNSAGSRFYRGSLPPNYPCNSRRCRYCGVIAESRLMPVWEALKLILKDPDYAYGQLKRYLQRNKERERVHERLAEIDHELSLLEKQRRKITIAFLETHALEESDYKRRLSENDATLERLLAERVKLTQVLMSEKERVGQAERIGRLFKRLKKSLENASYETRSKIIHLLIDRIDLYPAQNYAEVGFNFPGDHVPLLEAEKSPFLQDDRFGTGPTKDFRLTVKVPLITTQEWRKETCWMHFQEARAYQKHLSAAMTELAARKAEQLFV